MASAVGQTGAAALASAGSSRSTSPHSQSSECAGTAVPFAEDLIGEVLAGYRIRLAGAPDHGAAAEGLTALAGNLLRAGYRVDHLHLVLGLIHDWLHGVATEVCRTRAGPGEQLAVHLGSDALGDQR